MKKLLSNRLNLVLVIIIFLLLIGGVFAYQRFVAGRDSGQFIEEVDLAFDPEGPYALLYPRRDGNALVLNIKRTASYDAISYEMAYTSEGVDRGVMGTIDTKQKKGEYEQEILFGTCSKNVCKYDRDVENGTLVLHIKKGNKAFRMTTLWHLQKPDLALGVLTSGDNHFSYKIDPKAADLSLIQYTIINELSGAPKLPSGQVIAGKVYSINTPIAKNLPPGEVMIEMASDPENGSKIGKFDEAKNDWTLYNTKIEDSKLTASVEGSGIFTIFAPKK